MQTFMHKVRQWRTPGRLTLFVGGLLALWGPAVLVWMLVSGWLPGEAPAQFQLVGITVLLYLAIPTVLWGMARVLDGRSLAQYGLVGDWTNLALVGAGMLLGLAGLTVFLGFEGWLGWLRWDTSRLGGGGRLLLEGLLIGLGVGFMEELLFRGFLLHTFRRDYGLAAAWVITALVFALTHFIKPLEVILATWAQFVGLVVMGAVLVLARVRGGGRLGLSVGLHAGWVWGYYLVDTLDLVVYDRSGVPQWLTGIGGNPIAGLMGVCFLLVTAVVIRALPPVEPSAGVSAPGTGGLG